jgi:twitching motility protein PilT
MELTFAMSTGHPADTQFEPSQERRLNKYFKAAIKMQASDVHLKVGQTARLRLYGDLKSTKGEPFEKEALAEMVYELLSKEQIEKFKENSTLDFAYEYNDDHRFRVNVFMQRTNVSLVARRVDSSVPSFESLYLPPSIEKIAEAREGLVLVVGPTGCGKTTTIASMLDHIARTRPCHIVTIEDPIEYLFKDSKAIVSQREIGLDVPNFDVALTYLMRQDPDVVLVGEMRDAKTVTAGMRAAETGHMVFGTLHSSNASQAIHRLLDLFPQEERELTRQALAVALRGVISQVLVPSIKKDIDRVPAVEILLANPTVKKFISEGREGDLPGVIRSCQGEGMQYLTDHLCQLIMDGIIDPKEAFKYATNAEELKMAMKGIKTSTEGLM